MHCMHQIHQHYAKPKNLATPMCPLDQDLSKHSETPKIESNLFFTSKVEPCSSLQLPNTMLITMVTSSLHVIQKVWIRVSKYSCIV